MESDEWSLKLAAKERPVSGPRFVRVKSLVSSALRWFVVERLSEMRFLLFLLTMQLLGLKTKRMKKMRKKMRTLEMKQRERLWRKRERSLMSIQGFALQQLVL